MLGRRIGVGLLKKTAVATDDLVDGVTCKFEKRPTGENYGVVGRRGSVTTIGNRSRSTATSARAPRSGSAAGSAAVGWSLLPPLVWSTLMVFWTVRIYGAGIATLARISLLDSAAEGHNGFSLRVAGLVLSLVLTLVALHGIEFWLYAKLYLYLDPVSIPETAVYSSMITHGAIDFGDSEMTRQWRLASAIEGVNGVLLLGWSTAPFVCVLAPLGHWDCDCRVKLQDC